MAARKRPSPSTAQPPEPERAPEPFRPRTSASNYTEPVPVWARQDDPASAPGELVPVFLTNAVRTSSGPGPGPKMLPHAEASALLADRLAVPGDQAPQGWSG